MIKFLYRLLWLISLVGTAHASINSATIIKDTLQALPNCLHYQIPTHFCFWLDEWGEINTTPILDHYLPDLVVSVFNQADENPWFEMNKTIDVVGATAQKNIVQSIAHVPVSGGSHSADHLSEQDIIFKEAEVIGNPALLLIPSHGLLGSTVTPWRPYFQSLADSLLWRGLPPAALPEETAAIALNFKHHLGSGLINWGGIYPHEGKVIADHDGKAAMMIAMRATDLLTNSNVFAHVAKKISLSCGENCHASDIQENSKETYFQMIYPIVENNCSVPGSKSPVINQQGSYVWIVWRHYQGCANGDGKYLGRS